MDQRAGRSFVPAGKGGRQPSCINQQKAVGLGGQVEYSGHLMGNRLFAIGPPVYSLFWSRWMATQPKSGNGGIWRVVVWLSCGGSSVAMGSSCGAREGSPTQLFTITWSCLSYFSRMLGPDGRAVCCWEWGRKYIVNKVIHVSETLCASGPFCHTSHLLTLLLLRLQDLKPVSTSQYTVVALGNICWGLGCWIKVKDRKQSRNKLYFCSCPIKIYCSYLNPTACWPTSPDSNTFCPQGFK